VNSGYVKVYRSLLNHAIWIGGRFSRGQAWVELVMEAAYEDHESFATHGPAWIKRAQVLTTQTTLARRWKWDRETVRLFLRELERHSMVRIETSKTTSTGFTLITILNYEKFQSNGRCDSAIESAIDSPSTPHRLPTF
jgi:hypothetical protein